jgi:chromosome segregation protein
MHLKQLKLAGFKSFVDPTIIHFPSQLVGVLGPNGCGKSNIIDAVRWVMGESSAKNLRGESMADVIFNGASNRKPLGQASVELIFDNSLGRLAGPFSSYTDIAIKRVVTRAGDSTYYLNGARCRRRDITDIFLGTGSGARGYSIIGQGTISKIIEAKPEELRVYLEEAAGVSQYKERRRETLLRIEHTRENLVRVADIRDELGKQLQRLERQAKTAERYTLLKQEEHNCRAEILALKWRNLKLQQSIKHEEHAKLDTTFEEHNAALTSLSNEKIRLNIAAEAAHESNQSLQTKLYQVGTEMARLEQKIDQEVRDKKRLEEDKQRLNNEWQSAHSQYNEDKEVLQKSQESMHDLEQHVLQLRIDHQEHEEIRYNAQKQLEAWESTFYARQKKASESHNALKLSEMQYSHLQEKHQNASARFEQWHNEQQAYSLSELEITRDALQEQNTQLQEVLQKDEEQLQRAEEQKIKCQATLHETNILLNELCDAHVRVNTEHAVLSAALKEANACKNMQEHPQEWADKPRLLDVLEVEPMWQIAVETVLKDALSAYVFLESEVLTSQLDDCMRRNTSAITLSDSVMPSHPLPRLIEHIQGKTPQCVPHCASIYTANNLDEAIAQLPRLKAHESIILPSGVWLGPGWVKCPQVFIDDEEGLLVKKQKMGVLALQMIELQERITKTQALRDEHHASSLTDLDTMMHLERAVSASKEALRTNQHALTEQNKSISAAFSAEAARATAKENLTSLLEEIAAEEIELKKNLECLKAACEEHERNIPEDTQELANKKAVIGHHQNTANEKRIALHQAELAHSQACAHTQQLTQRIAREAERIQLIQERLEQLAQQSTKTLEPQQSLSAQLETQVLAHQEIETQLIAKKEELLLIREALEGLEQTLAKQHADATSVQNAIAELRLLEHELTVKSSAILEALQEMQLTPEALLEHIPPQASQEAFEETLIHLCDQIKRLGAINLAAIEEYATEQQRHHYLNEQHADLHQALEMLEGAIAHIDEETRKRLQDTFEAVNSSFQVLFPRLFGGGRAQLVLTCDNLLEAGIVVMAQPPGKRNSTIYLLSGGEKAMTAVALVFALFQLNPSPFCMLDEVDAPLDDVNVGRFCDLVKEMSQFVQFLLITHNKVTMELAEHLIGVTMREPGVSRIVTVDVKQVLTESDDAD